MLMTDGPRYRSISCGKDQLEGYLIKLMNPIDAESGADHMLYEYLLKLRPSCLETF